MTDVKGNVNATDVINPSQRAEMIRKEISALWMQWCSLMSTLTPVFVAANWVRGHHSSDETGSAVSFVTTIWLSLMSLVDM